MNYNPEKHHRRSIRLKEYDYSQAGAYFITICAHNRQLLVGKIVDGQMQLNESGEIIRKCWLEIPQYFLYVVIDEYIIMPNHIHGIIFIVDNVGAQNYVGAQNFVPLQMKQNKFQNIIPHSIGSIICGFKIGVSKWFRQNTDKKTIWQRNYHEHIIRNEDELNRIRQYIINNPLQWGIDRENLDKGAKYSAPTN